MMDEKAAKSIDRRLELTNAVLKWQAQMKGGNEKGRRSTKIDEFDWATITALLGENEGADAAAMSSSGPVTVTEEKVKECMELWTEICASQQPSKDSLSLSSSKGKRKRKIDVLRKELDDNGMNPYRIHAKMSGTYAPSEGEVVREDGISTRRAKLKSSATGVYPEHYYYDTSILFLCDPILMTSGQQEPRKKCALLSQNAASNALSAALLSE